jgi:hypothetical protein
MPITDSHYTLYKDTSLFRECVRMRDVADWDDGESHLQAMDLRVGY